MTHLPDPRRKRLLFRSWHRGTREADLILGSFAEQHLAGFDAAQLDRYEGLLNLPDPDIFDWLISGLLTMLASLPLYHIFQRFDAFADQDALNEGRIGPK